MGNGYGPLLLERNGSNLFQRKNHGFKRSFERKVPFPSYKNENPKTFSRGKWDFADLYYREVEGLDNNSQFFTAGSNIKLSCAYIRNISSGLSLEAGIDFQLLSVMTESMSFAFSEPQETLEQGKFSYQDESF